MRKLVLILLFFATMCGAYKVSAQEASSRGFNLIVVGDSQPQTEAQMASLEQDIIPQIGEIVNEYRTTSNLPVAILITGDVVWDTMKFLPRVKRAFESLEVPVYAVIGNHDHNRKQSRNQRRAEECFEETFGARNQSFILGETLFLTFDNIEFRPNKTYYEGIDVEQLMWLSEVMENTPKDMRVAACMHALATDRNTNILKPYAKPVAAIVGERELHFISGHHHNHGTYDVSPSVIEHNVAQVSGNLWFAPICSDGTPRGVFCIEERDGEWSWHHRLLGKSPSDVLIAWNEGYVEGNEEYVVVKAIGWDSKWVVEWFENGESRGEMEQIELLDPDYLNYVEREAGYKKKYVERLRRSAHPHKHYFRLKRTIPDSDVRIVATDRFGRTYETAVN